MDKHAILHRNTAILWRELETEAVLLDPEQGLSFTLNRVGTRIWQLADGRSRETIANVLYTEFDAPQADLDNDVDEFITQLIESRLLLVE